MHRKKKQEWDKAYILLYTFVLHYFFLNSANENVVIEDAKIELSGHSMREYAKLTYHLKFPEATPLLDLTSLKLRSGENDKSMIREKLYVNLLNNIGVPAQQTTYIRLFWNGEPIGLFVAMEVLRENWVRKVLHPNITNVPVGSLWRMNASSGKEANLQWLGPATKSHDIYDRYILLVKNQNGRKDSDMLDLVAFMKDLKDYDPKKTKDPIAYWQKRLDLDIFLKSMVMEYLTTAFDAYWQSGSNYQMYHDPVTKKWVWLPMDFDDTFSRDIVSYKKIPRINKKGFESHLVSKLILDTPAINAKFEDHVKTITSYIFKPQALNPYLDAHLHMIEEDVAWDRKLPRVAKGGRTYNFKLEDLYKGVQQELKAWIKERHAQIQKDMHFKAPTVVTNRVPAHNMHPKQLSVYGIKPQPVEPKNIKVPASVADAVPASVADAVPASVADAVPASVADAVPASVADAVPTAPTADQEAGDTEDMKEESATAITGEKISNSASMTGSHWATLGALVAAVVLVA
jgi:hypothetical protein